MVSEMPVRAGHGVLDVFDPAAVERLRGRLAGQVLAPQDAGYDDARRVWNASIDRHPALIARCTGVADVIAAVRFARERNLLVAVRGGGHNVAGNATCDGGMVIDLSPMKGVRVDPLARRVQAQAGLVWRELDRETQAFGLAVTGGLISSTGVAGFTLGGGIGWLQRKYGLAIDSLAAADLVTADGELLHVSPDDHAELFWGLRGGGGNFGIVTSFEFDLHPVGPQVVAGLVFHRGEDLPEVARCFRGFMAQAPDEVTLVLVHRLAPPAPFLPEQVHGTPVVAVAGMHAGPPEQAERDLAELKGFGRPIVDVLQRRPYTQFQTMLDASWQPGFHNYWKAEYLAGLPDPALDVLADGLARITSPLSDFKLATLGGAISRVGEDDTAYSYRGAPLVLNVNARWCQPGAADPHVAWTQDLWQAMRPWSAGGVYVNFLGDEGQDRIRAAYGERKYERLVVLKNRYDPTNFFRLNQNIQPTV
jgi:FAD/FMN-containing dehydrogenase